MAGSMIGNVVANSMFGGHRSEPAPAPAAAPATAAPAEAAPPAMASATVASNEIDQCVFPRQSLSQCMTQNKEQIGSCQWAYDMLNECTKGMIPVRLARKYCPTSLTF